MGGGLSLLLFRFLPFPLLMLMPFISEDIRNGWRARRQAQQTGDLGEDLIDSPESDDLRDASLPPAPFLYGRYPCTEGNPLACGTLCDIPEAVAPDSDADSANTPKCATCDFPLPLEADAEILGRRGRYRISQLLGYRGLGRLYRAMHLQTDQPVIIKEYLLPVQYFNEAEQQQIKELFETVAGLNLADGRTPDFRLMSPWEAIADRHEERCYVVVKGAVDSYPSLRHHLHQEGAFDPADVRLVLDQILQTFESLHCQKFVMPTGHIRTGLAHGNVNLDSLLILPDSFGFFERSQLLVYLRDLSLWEHIFSPPPLVAKTPSPRNDLISLGRVAFYLLAGRWTDDQVQPLNPRHSDHWPHNDLALEQFVRRLLELETPFETAALARQALLALPTDPSRQIETLDPLAEEAPKAKRRWWTRRTKKGLLIILIALLGGSLTWWLVRRRLTLANAIEPQQPAPQLCCIADVPAVPAGTFSYTADVHGSWTTAWLTENLVQKGYTLAQMMAEQRPTVDLAFNPAEGRDEAIAQVRNGTMDFAVASQLSHRGASHPSFQLAENIVANGDLAMDAIAYDALVVFVPFSYHERQNGLPQGLNGQITLHQLRRLYTGEVQNWQELGGPDLPVQRYIPLNADAIHVFEQKVLQTEEAIATFRQNLPKHHSHAMDASFIENQVPLTHGATAIQEETLPMLRQMLREFEAGTSGGIGFAPLSQVFGQCSVYPLAIRTPGQTAVQPIRQTEQDGSTRPITPALDLCEDKGRYEPNMDVLQPHIGQALMYPLAYPLAVIYPRDNSRPAIGQAFVELIKTQESQALLSKTGLVPLVPAGDAQ